MTEEQVHISGLKEGDTSSFEYLYNLWSGKLYNFVMKMSKGEQYLAEEIVQSVFIKIWETRRSLDVEKSFTSYIFTIAKNQLINVYQRRMSEALYLEESKLFSLAENTTDKDVDYHLLDEFINTLTEQLPPARKEIFILSRRYFLSNKEIANKLNLSENTIESQLRKAIAFLRDKINRYYNSMIFTILFCLIDK